MTVYAAADLHGMLPSIPSDATALVIAGDICPDFTIGGRLDTSGSVQSDWLDTTFRGWLERIDVPVHATWGNHDFVGQRRELVPDLPWHLYVDEGATIEGLRYWFTPWVPNLPSWAFHGSEVFLRHRADMIPDWAQVLVSHGPPYRAGDLVAGGRGLHVGERALCRAINRVKPRVVVCGHVHEARGWHYVDDVPVLNAAAVDENYDPYAHSWMPIQNAETPDS